MASGASWWFALGVPLRGRAASRYRGGGFICPKWFVTGCVGCHVLRLLLALELCVLLRVLFGWRDLQRWLRPWGAYLGLLRVVDWLDAWLLCLWWPCGLVFHLGWCCCLLLAGSLLMWLDVLLVWLEDVWWRRWYRRLFSWACCLAYPLWSRLLLFFFFYLHRWSGGRWRRRSDRVCRALCGLCLVMWGSGVVASAVFCHVIVLGCRGLVLLVWVVGGCQRVCVRAVARASYLPGALFLEAACLRLCLLVDVVVVILRPAAGAGVVAMLRVLRLWVLRCWRCLRGPLSVRRSLAVLWRCGCLLGHLLNELVRLLLCRPCGRHLSWSRRGALVFVCQKCLVDLVHDGVR